MRAAACATLISVLGALPAGGHAAEVWATPKTSKGGVKIAIDSAGTFPQGARPIRPDRVEANMLMGEDRLEQLRSWKVEGASLAARAPELAPGWYLFQFALRPVVSTTKAGDFDRYLEKAGLDAARRERVRLKESDRPGRERTTSLGKTLVRVGEPESGPPTLGAAGAMFDLVPETDPTGWNTGDAVEVRAVYRGEPAIARQVSLVCVSGAAREVRRATTNAHGVAKIEVPPGRNCLLSSTDMRRLEADEAADWETTSTSFTFQRR